MPVTRDKAVKTVLCVLSEETFPYTVIRVLKPLSELGSAKHHQGRLSGQSGVYTPAGLKLKVGRKVAPA